MNRIAGIIAHPVTSHTELNRLKQSLLLCDIVGFFAVDSQIISLKKHSFRQPVLGHIANELQKLLDSGHLIEAVKANEKFSFPVSAPVALEFIREGSIINSIDAKLGNKKYDIKDRGKDYELMEEAKARLACMKLNYEEHDFTAVPLISHLRLPKESNATKNDVISLIINNMPIPDEYASWESILEFKSDADNRGRLSMLKDWMNKSVSSNRPINEIRDELESLLYQYRKSLEIHNIKHSTGTLQTIIVSSAEFVENALRLKFSEIAKSIFSIRTAQADLYDAELNSPGNALAYIYKASKFFNS